MTNKGKNNIGETEIQGPRVGDLLKATRERADIHLQRVAEVLRIRLVYLEAIEDNRYEALPGKTYVIGFVRAYAEYLGLDVDEVVNRFKQEVDGMAPKAELVFPSPVTEQSVPSGAIIMIGLIVIGVAYGGWYFLSSQDRDMAELVPDLPAKFAEMVEKVKPESVPEEQSTTETPPGAEQNAANSEAAQVTQQPDTQDMAAQARKAVEDAVESEENTPPAPVETVAVEAETSEVTPSESTEVTQNTQNESAPVAPSDPVVTAEETVAEQEPVGENQAPAVEEQVTQSPVEEAASEQQAVSETSEEAPVEAEVDTAAVPSVMEETVILRGLDYAWVQVTNGEGTVLHTQVLNEGDEYQIPAETGLILRTGNAGGLEILVDGEKAPSIGGLGEVRRKVLMDPQRLMAGNAVEN